MAEKHSEKHSVIHPLHLSETELHRVVEHVRKALKTDLVVVRRWFWAAIGTAVGAALTQIIALVVVKYFR